MMTSESIFVNNIPVGRLLVDTDSKEVTFLPAISPSKLPEKDYASVEELRNAVIAAYQGEAHGAGL